MEGARPLSRLSQECTATGNGGSVISLNPPSPSPFPPHHSVIKIVQPPATTDGPSGLTQALPSGSPGGVAGEPAACLGVTELLTLDVDSWDGRATPSLPQAMGGAHSPSSPPPHSPTRVSGHWRTLVSSLPLLTHVAFGLGLVVWYVYRR